MWDVIWGWIWGDLVARRVENWTRVGKSIWAAPHGRSPVCTDHLGPTAHPSGDFDPAGPA